MLNQSFVNALEQKYYEIADKSDFQVSLLHLEVVDTLKQLNLNFKVEEKVLGWDVDVVVYDKEWRKLIGIIEIHGYHHFFRNKKHLTGSSVFKENIMKREVEHYYTIDIDEWMILDKSDRKGFLENLLKDVIIER